MRFFPTTTDSTLRNGLHVQMMLVLLALLCSTVASNAQRSSNDPLEFSYIYNRIGGDIGLMSVWQSGSYVAGCGVFERGARLNPLLALSYDQPVGNIFRLEAMLGYQSRGLSSRYNSRENVVLSTQNAEIPVDIDFENLGSANFHYLFALPSMKLYIVDEFFVGGGIGFNVLLSASTQYTKNILSQTVVIDDLGLTEVFYPESESSDPYSKVFEPESRSDASTVGLDGVGYVGAEFRATNDMYITPRVLFSYPFTSVLSNPSLSTYALQFLVGVRFNMP